MVSQFRLFIRTINPTQIHRLEESLNISFRGTQKGGAFDISYEKAQELLQASGNPNGRPNSDVVKPWINGTSLVKQPQNKWIIDFGVAMSESEASLYEQPFEYVKQRVYPQRKKNKRARRRENWWLHSETAPGMREAVAGLSRYIATPRISKYRLFAWVSPDTIPDDGTYIFGRDDDYFFGVLQSKPHDLWARATGTQLREAESGFRYTATTTFETFPFPWPPGKEPKEDSRVKAIAEAARELVEKRDNWLNPPGLPEKELKQRTLTNLYNQRPTWLALAHEKLDRAVLAAYGWPHELGDEEILERLLALNLERAGG
jgi:type II restriction/modification system DNA methylase subunit YeeA